MQLKMYVRKPFDVIAIRVTEENMKEAADTFEATVHTDSDNQKYIKVDVGRVFNKRLSSAYVGDWIVERSNKLRVFTNKAFRDTFEEPTGEQADAIVQRNKPQPETQYSMNPVTASVHPEEKVESWDE